MVRAVNEAAFGQRVEADLVEALHRANVVVVSLVAELDGYIVGHILFSPVSVDGTSTPLVGLGPMAVLPQFQRRGIGGLLIREGLERCRESGIEGTVVVGHPEYYPRFGFRPAHQFGLHCEYDVPPEVFMTLELVPGSLHHVTGLVRYHQAFANV